MADLLRKGAATGAALLALLQFGPADARDRITRVPATATAPATAPDAPASAGDAAAVTRVAAGSGGALAVTIDHAKVVKLPENTQTVVVGNPAIADFSVQRNGIVVVTGKSYGTTNLIALDGTGAMLAEANVSVVAPSEGVMVVQRGFDRQSYSCNPACQPSVILGDSNAFFNDNRGQADARNQFATSR